MTSSAPSSFECRIDRVTESEWNSLIGQFSDANIYQTWAYGAACWDERQLSHLVLYRDGIAVALAQVRVVRVPVLRSGIAYVRWGPVCVPWHSTWDIVVWRATLEALVREYALRRGLLLRLIPQTFQQETHATEMLRTLSDLGLVEDSSSGRYHSFRVDLRASEDRLRRQLSSRWRRQLNIAERNELEIVEGRTLPLYEQFVTLYDEMMTRKRFDTTVDVHEFGRMQQRLPDAQKMMTFVCRADRKPVAGLVVSMVGDTSIYLLAATGDEGLNARGSYLLQWHALRTLKALGHRWYDLGGANEEVNPGVYTFKSGMGGEAVCQLGRHEIRNGLLNKLSVSLGESATQMIRRVTGQRQASARNSS